MTEPTRADAFKSEIAAMGIKDPTAGRDRRLLALGMVMMVTGIALGVLGYFGSHGTTNPLSQRDFIVLSIIGLSVSVVGAAVFLRFSLAGFLRFWLARLIYEQQAQTDRLLLSSDQPQPAEHEGAPADRG